MFVSVILIFVGIEEAPRNAKMLGATPGILFTLFSILIVASIQAGRANVDSAEYGQQMLKIARDQLDVSRQSLKRQEADRNSFAALRSADEDAPKASFERREPSVSTKPKTSESGDYRGHKIFRVGGSYRAIGDVFSSREEAMSAIDKKLDAPAIENKPDLPSSMLFGPEPTTASEKQPIPVDQTSADRGPKAPRSYAEAETPAESDEPGVTAGTNRDLAGEETAGEMTEAKPASSADPATVATEEEPATKIKEEDGKFLYGRMEFSSREAAEKYVRQLGVNPNFRS